MKKIVTLLCMATEAFVILFFLSEWKEYIRSFMFEDIDFAYRFGSFSASSILTIVICICFIISFQYAVSSIGINLSRIYRRMLRRVKKAVVILIRHIVLGR